MGRVVVTIDEVPNPFDCWKIRFTCSSSTAITIVGILHLHIFQQETLINPIACTYPILSVQRTRVWTSPRSCHYGQAQPSICMQISYLPYLSIYQRLHHAAFCPVVHISTRLPNAYLHAHLCRVPTTLVVAFPMARDTTFSLVRTARRRSC